jgi:hypothetical protein
MPAEPDVVTHGAAMQIVPIEGGATFEQNQTIRFQIRSGDFIDSGSVMFAIQYKQTTANGAANANLVRPASGFDLFVLAAHHLFQHWRRDRRHRTSDALLLPVVQFGL